MNLTLEELNVCYCDVITYAKVKELRSMPKLRVLKYGQSWNFGEREKQTLKKLMPLVRFGESICVDERELLPADGIWDVEAKQLEYCKKLEKHQFQDLPNEFTFDMLRFLEIKDLAKFGQVSKIMRIFAQQEICLRSREICQRLSHPISHCQKCLCQCRCQCKKLKLKFET